MSIRVANSLRRSLTYGLMRTGSRSTSAATVRLECLGRHWFLDLDDAREKIEEWRTEYNEVRPHSAIGDRTPMFLIHQPRQTAEAHNRPEILS